MELGGDREGMTESVENPTRFVRYATLFYTFSVYYLLGTSKLRCW